MADRDGVWEPRAAGAGAVALDGGVHGEVGAYGRLVRASDGRLGSWIRELVTRRDLLLMIAWREIKVKYKQSVMGLLWAVLMPAVIVSAGVLVKYAFASMSKGAVSSGEIVNVAVRSVPWAFFVASLRFSSLSLISNSNLVTKIYMPRVIFPLSAILSQLFDLAVASVVLGIVVALSGVHLSLYILWTPVLLVLLCLLVSGLGIFLAAAGLFFRDVKYLVEVILTFAIFFTPVFYDVSMFGQWANVLMLNPVAPLLEGISAAVLSRPMPASGWLLYSAAASVLTFVVALVLFKRMEPYFAESV